MKERDISIDIARGIAILGVLYGHSLDWQGTPRQWLFYWLWSFHMALFAVVSGYFYKEKTITGTIVSSAKVLLLPYVIVYFIVFLLGQIENFEGVKPLVHSFIVGAINCVTFRDVPHGFWFVVALFNCRVILAFVSKVRFKYKYLLLAFVSIVIVFIPYHVDVFQFSRSFALLLFMIIGIYAKKYNVLELAVNKRVIVILGGVILVAARWMNMGIHSYNYPLGAFNFITASIICFALIQYCRLLDNSKLIILKLIKNILAFCGIHSLLVLSFQAIYGEKFVFLVQKYTGIDNRYTLMLIFVISCIISSYLFNKLKIDISKLRTKL